jgi:hypothetical protein
MKADLRSGDGPERHDLRSFLRQWDVPSPPPDIEGDLRRTFRRRRAAKGRPSLWLSLAAAAALAVVALWRIEWHDRVATPAPTERPVAVASPLPPPPETAEAGRPRSSAPGAGEPSPPEPVAHRHRRQIPAAREAEVIVEPGQARLLVELGQKLRDVRQAAAGDLDPRHRGDVSRAAGHDRGGGADGRAGVSGAVGNAGGRVAVRSSVPSGEVTA